MNNGLLNETVLFLISETSIQPALSMLSSDLQQDELWPSP